MDGKCHVTKGQNVIDFHVKKVKEAYERQKVLSAGLQVLSTI